MESKVKEILRRGEVALGSFVTEFGLPSVAEIYGLSGFDFLVADTEHSAFNLETVANLVRGAKAAGLDTIVRIRENSPSLFAQALDLGAEGLLVPHCDTKEDAIRAVRAAKYAPLGERGVFGAGPAAKYGTVEGYFEKANRGTLLAVQIESALAVENIEEILEVEGIDVFFVGPYDLSQSLGRIGQITDPEVERAVKKVIAAAKERQRDTGILVLDYELARKWLKEGVRFLAYGVDAIIFRQALGEIARTLKQGG